MEPVFDEKKIMIKFEGQTHQVDVNTLTSSLVVFSESLKEINKSLGTGKNLEIKIEALKPGSFEIHTIVTAINNNDLLTAIATVSGVVGGTAATIGAAYTGIVKLRSWLKKEDKQVESTVVEGDKTVIKAKSGDTFICSNVVYNIYNTNQIVNDQISDQFRILEEDAAIDGLTISSETDQITVPKEDFSGLAEKVDIIDQNKKKERKEKQTLYVVKPVLEKSPTRRWEFIWNGLKISANISDMSFLEKVAEGEHRFGMGDTLIADIDVNQVLNPMYNAWLNESYQVVLVHDHTIRKVPEKGPDLFGLQ